MWLSYILGFLVLFVIWVDTNNVTQEDIYKLKVWKRDPKYENKRKSMNMDMKFRYARAMDPMSMNIGENATEVLPIRKFRLPLKERIRGAKERRYDDEEKEPKGKDDGVPVKSTKGAVHLVDHSTAKPKKHKKGKYSEEEKHNKKLKPLQEDQGEDKSSIEQLSVYAMKQNMGNIAQELGKETNITVEVIGRTFEYNDIVILKMTEVKSEISKYFRANDDTKYMDEVPEKKILFIVHALSVMGVRNLRCLSRTKYFKQLLKFYLEHLDKFDIFLIPMANPDGFTVTSKKRHWNKNTSPQSSCRGVDLERNFDVAWSEAGQVSECSQHYPGPNSFSEPETRAVREVFHRYSHKIAAYIHVHAASCFIGTYKGDAVLYPKGYTEATSDDDRYMDMKGEIDEAMRNASFRKPMVTVDTLYHWYGKVTGTSVDYAATVFGIPFAMEFLMETYEAKQEALNVIWKRVIDAVFNFIHKKSDSNNNNDV